MEDTLQAIHPGLMWEYGNALRGPGHRLVITPESQRFLRPMVRTILERAPKLEAWEFYPYRPAETAEQTIETVKARVGVEITGAVIDAAVVPGRKVDLAFAFPGHRFKDETAMQAAFVATETLMGEQVLDTWIGRIELLYSYIDLALTDIKRAAPIIRKTLSHEQAPLRSWLLFHDDDYAAEWIGLYGQTPAPPQVQIEA
jgi:hypothetical protein